MLDKVLRFFRKKEIKPLPWLVPEHPLYGKNLSWLADAPLFIDEDMVARFYDAVVSPATETVEIQVAQTVSRQTELAGEANIGGEIGLRLPQFISDYFNAKSSI